MSKKGNKVGPSTWLVIALLVASVLLELADIFTSGSLLMWLGAGCLLVALGIMASRGRSSKR